MGYLLIVRRKGASSHILTPYGTHIMVRQFTTSSGKTVLVGENAGENQQLCKNAKQNDQWFHLDNGPSPHVVLSCQGKPASRDDIHDCAQLVKYFSKHRFVISSHLVFINSPTNALTHSNTPRVNVHHLPCKFVSKNGVEDHLGKVTLKKSPTRIPVVTDDSTISRLVSTSASSSR